MKSQETRCAALEAYGARAEPLWAISARLGVFPGQIRRWAKVAGIPLRNAKAGCVKHHISRAEFVRLYSSGRMRVEDIAEKLGVSKSTTIRWRRALDLERRADRVGHREFTKGRENAKIRRAARRINSRIVHAKTTTKAHWLGCSLSFARRYLETRFEAGMSWANYGTAWHIDHVTPLSCFDLTKERQRKKAMHYSNLQPLWSGANMAKSDVTPQQTELAI